MKKVIVISTSLRAGSNTLRFALPDTISAQQIRTIALSKELNFCYFKNADVGMSIDETTDITAVNARGRAPRASIPPVRSARGS